MSRLPELHPRAKRAWFALIVVLGIEAFGGLALLVPVALDMLAASGEPLGPRLSIVLSFVIAWLWVCVTLVGALRAKASWVRGSALTIHVLMFAAGTGVLQMQLAGELVGWTLVALALAGFFAALLARPVVTDAPLEISD